MIKVSICLLLLCMFFLVWYIVYTVVHPQPTPPSLARSMLPGTRGGGTLQFNNEH